MKHNNKSTYIKLSYYNCSRDWKNRSILLTPAIAMISQTAKQSCIGLKQVKEQPEDGFPTTEMHDDLV